MTAPPAADIAEPEAEGTPPLTLEFTLDPAAAARLPRHPAFTAARAGRRARTMAEELIWQDTPEGKLAARGVALQQPRRGETRQVQLFGDATQPWLPGTPAPEQPAEESVAGLVPLAAFSGRRSIIPLGSEEAPLTAELLAGKLRCVAAEEPVARLLLRGAPGDVLGLARRLAVEQPLLPPVAALPEAARALARAEAPRPRRRGPPDLGAAGTVEAALIAAIGHLLEAMLFHVPLCRIEAGPEGVHQTRVALRRLRSVLKAFRPAAKCAALDAFDDGLKRLARDLGTARDLDVFLLGIGARMREAMPGERRLAQLLRAVEARRNAAYAALQADLAAPAFRLLVLDGIALLLERPWRAEATGELDEPLTAFGARLLDKRWHRLCAEGETIHHLDDEGLHELRLTGKRLRYAAELFAPLWPGKAQRRFLKRLAVLQEELGLANDVAVARGIVGSLGGSAPAWAVGAVDGFATARLGGARRKGIEAWENLMVAKPFWSDL